MITDKVYVRFDPHISEYLQALKRTGIYGNDVNDVIETLVLGGIREAVGNGIIDVLIADCEGESS